jgi:hypothetical protein
VRASLRPPDHIDRSGTPISPAAPARLG